MPMLSVIVGDRRELLVDVAYPKTLEEEFDPKLIDMNEVNTERGAAGTRPEGPKTEPEAINFEEGDDFLFGVMAETAEQCIDESGLRRLRYMGAVLCMRHELEAGIGIELGQLACSQFGKSVIGPLAGFANVARHGINFMIRCCDDRDLCRNYRRGAAIGDVVPSQLRVVRGLHLLLDGALGEFTVNILVGFRHFKLTITLCHWGGLGVRVAIARTLGPTEPCSMIRDLDHASCNT
mmetsp:Transcript_33873/g.108261  ORF Transcript_33873/g.108261 Transcript_33873/m.108261 type:complete len:236 (+) Transcript_33873:2642-3349(+)